MPLYSFILFYFIYFNLFILVRTKADDAADDGVRGGDVPAIVARHGQPDGANAQAGGHAVRCDRDL